MYNVNRKINKHATHLCTQLRTRTHDTLDDKHAVSAGCAAPKVQEVGAHGAKGRAIMMEKAVSKISSWGLSQSTMGNPMNWPV